MPIGAYKVQSIPAGGGPFPCFGTALTAATVPNPTPQNDIYPSGQLPMTVTVSDTSMFKRPGLRALLVKANGTLSIPCDVSSINSATSITVRFQYAGIPSPQFAIGDFLVLNETVQSITVQGFAGSTGDYYFGVGPTFTQTNGRIWHSVKTPVATDDPFMNTSLIFGGFSINTSELWVLGTAGDQFCPSTLV